MVLEATVIIVDNSEWTRNGDYSPSRLEAAKEATNSIASRKLADNVENCVGIMSMGGLNGKCLLSLTSEVGKISNAVGLIKHEEGCNFESSIKIAQIVLKHRQNTNQKQRIIAFLGSPLGSSKESLKELGSKMKKNGIAIDIIDYGTENRGNTEILSELIESINTEAHPSHLITIETNSESNQGIFLLDALKSRAPELFNRSGGGGSSNAMMDSGDGFDFDPEMDPELAMALKLSMEEEINRQKAGTTANTSETVNETDVANEEEEEEEDDEEMMMARAIALSMEQSNNNNNNNNNNDQ